MRLCFPSERCNGDGSCSRVGDDALRRGLAAAAGAYLPGWPHTLTPHVLRHYCASQLYLNGMDLVAIQELLGHSWIATTMGYVNPRELHQTGEKPLFARSTWCWSSPSGPRVTAS